MTVAERFWNKVDLTGPNGCWLWTASVNNSGYGWFWHEGRSVGAHRFAYEALVGPIPDGLQIDHLCRMRTCVNPAHLEPVTCRENILRGDGGGDTHNAAKTECLRGHPLDNANTYATPDGRRNCRSCRSDAKRRYNARQRAMTRSR